jgi:hypothetical protein
MIEASRDDGASKVEASLLPWANLGLGQVDDEIASIHRLELQAGPIPQAAQTIRSLITRLEVCHFKVERHVRRITEAIGKMSLDLDPASIGHSHPKSGETAWLRDRTGRSRQGQEFIWVLQMWLTDTPYSDADPRGIPRTLFEKVNRALGERTPQRTLLVSALRDRLLLKSDRQPLPPELAEFWEPIERTDICHYSFPTNLEKTIEGIGRLEPVPDFAGCGSFDDSRSRMAQECFRALCAWSRGERSSLACQLGDTSPVKEWLVACLAKTLKEQVGLPESLRLR